MPPGSSGPEKKKKWRMTDLMKDSSFFDHARPPCYSWDPESAFESCLLAAQ